MRQENNAKKQSKPVFLESASEKGDYERSRIFQGRPSREMARVGREIKISQNKKISHHDKITKAIETIDVLDQVIVGSQYANLLKTVELLWA